MVKDFEDVQSPQMELKTAGQHLTALARSM